MPLQSHSSKNGANTDTERKLTQSGPSSIAFIACSRCSGIGGSQALSGSAAKAAARVATDTMTAIQNPPRCPKCLLSSAYPDSNMFALRLCTDAYIIGGTNIRG